MLLLATVFGLLLPQLLALVSWKKILPNFLVIHLIVTLLFFFGGWKIVSFYDWHLWIFMAMYFLGLPILFYMLAMGLPLVLFDTEPTFSTLVYYHLSNIPAMYLLFMAWVPSEEGMLVTAVVNTSDNRFLIAKLAFGTSLLFIQLQLAQLIRRYRKEDEYDKSR